MISENKTFSTPLLLYHFLYSQVGCKLSQMENSHMLEVLLSCYMLNTIILSCITFVFTPISSGCFTVHYFTSVTSWVLSHKSYVFTICLCEVFICWILLHLPLVYRCSLCHLLFWTLRLSPAMFRHAPSSLLFLSLIINGKNPVNVSDHIEEFWKSMFSLPSGVSVFC